MEYIELCKMAAKAKEKAYVPYSHHRVGAALLAKNGTVYQGCNIENCAYTPTNCAERTAFFKAVSEGCMEFQAIAISGDSDDFLYPCGVCRQVMAEFCDMETFEVIVSKPDLTYQVYKLKDLLPGGFTPEELKKGIR